MVQVDGGKGVVGGEYVGDAVSMPGLHSGECSGIITPRARVGGAGMSSRIPCLIWRLLPLPVRLLGPAPYCPLRPLDQWRQSARQLRQVALMRCRLGHGNTLGRNG